MQKVPYCFNNERFSFVLALRVYSHYILGSFNSLKVLFHLSLTVLVCYWLLKILGLRVDSQKQQM